MDPLKSFFLVVFTSQLLCSSDWHPVSPSWPLSGVWIAVAPVPPPRGAPFLYHGCRRRVLHAAALWSDTSLPPVSLCWFCFAGAHIFQARILCCYMKQGEFKRISCKFTAQIGGREIDVAEVKMKKCSCRIGIPPAVDSVL